MAETTFYVSQACHMDETQPDDTSGGDSLNTVYMDDSGGKGFELEMRLLCEFDLSSIIGHTITSASIWVYPNTSLLNADKLAIRFHKILREFVGTEATWNDWKTDNAWSGGGADVDNEDVSPTHYSQKSYFALNFDPVEFTTCAGLVRDALTNHSGILRVRSETLNYLGSGVCFVNVVRASTSIVVTHTAPAGGGSRNWGTVIGSRLGLPSLPEGWRRRGLVVPVGA